MSSSFKIAPMSALIRRLTVALWLLPLFFGVYAIVSHEWIAGIICLVLITFYGAVWVWCRPSRFVVSHNHLKIVFPGWHRSIPMEDVSEIRIMSKEAFRQEFGMTIRICVGGLWGGFGWLWTKRRGLLEFYISRVDGFVLIERLTGKSLLITPENPAKMLAAAQR